MSVFDDYRDSLGGKGRPIDRGDICHDPWTLEQVNRIRRSGATIWDKQLEWMDLVETQYEQGMLSSGERRRLLDWRVKW